MQSQGISFAPSRVGVGGATGAKEGGGNLRKVADDSGASGANVDEHTRNLHAIVDGGQMQRGAAVPASRVTLRAPLESIARKLRSKVTRITVDTSRARSRLLLRRRAAGRRQRAPFQRSAVHPSLRGGRGVNADTGSAMRANVSMQVRAYCCNITHAKLGANHLLFASTCAPAANSHFQMALFSRAVQRRPAAPGRSTT